MTVVSLVVRRIAGMCAVVLVASVAVFSLLELSPGSPEQTLLGPTGVADAQAVREIRQQYGLEEPLPIRFLTWLGSAVRLDFGASLRSGEDVSSLLAQRAEVTIELSVFALCLVLLVCVPAGVLSAVWRGRALDRGVSTVAIVCAGVPPFALGVLLVSLVSVRLGLFPPLGAGDDGADRIYHLVLPAVTLAAMQSAIIVRQTRAAALDVVSADYVVFARACSLPWSRVLWKYLIRNTAVQVVTASGLLLALSLSGAVLVESVFAIPGLGALVVESVTARDIPVLQGLTFLVAGLVVLINLGVDLAVLAIDPRTRTAGAYS